MNLSRILIALLAFSFLACSKKTIGFYKEDISLINRELIALNNQALELNNRTGDGLAVLQKVNFNEGSIEVEIKGENTPGKSFVGIAFNIQNDSTYEVVYFRPFNFRSAEQIRRAHSVQYISHPKHTWRYLRTNFEGQYEAEFPRKPDPTDFFKVRINIRADQVRVYDMETNTELLAVTRLEKQQSDKIGLWTGFDSKGAFRKLRIQK
ncbi:MAG: hypothetical protein ED555_12775 [Allomuricauda sp.]|nr:MAG: hypothetical protein ED555_12775 [Allomuricauda sp.]